MKKILKLALFAILAIGMFSACKDDEAAPDEQNAKARFVSFGFYADKNVGNLTKDYIAQISGRSIVVEMPGDVDKTNLVATFTTTENDSVYVSNVKQISEITGNNYSSPIEFVVSDGNDQTVYTVMISKDQSKYWEYTGATDSLYSELALKVNPITNIPYICAKKSSKLTEYKDKASLLKYENKKWVTVGGEYFSDGTTSDPTIDFGSNGDIYCAYIDKTTTPIASAVTMKKYSNSQWQLVGARGFTDHKAGYLNMTITTGDKPFVFEVNQTKNLATFAQRDFVMSSYNNGVWNSALLPGRGSKTTTTNYAITKYGATYVSAIKGGSPQNISIYKYKDSQWETLAEDLRTEGTEYATYAYHLDVDKSGNVYLVYSDASTDYLIQVKKYTLATKTWSTLGNTPADAKLVNTKIRTNIAVSPDGTPYLLYLNINQQLVITYYSNETKDWVKPKTVGSNSYSDITLTFASNGNGYICAINKDTDKIETFVCENK